MTNTQNDCPEPQTLQKFLLGQLSVVEIEECQDHLSVCNPCVETVQDLKAEDTFTDLTRQAFSNSQTSLEDDDAIVNQMIQDFGAWDHDSFVDRSENERQDVSMDRAVEVHRLLRESDHSEDLGRIAHFRVLELIGSGSTGVVYRAIDTRLERNVVLKILRPSLGEAARSRFVAEAKATAAIEHENVIAIYEVGNDGPLSFIAMQWVPGQTLEQMLAVQETLTLEQTERIVGQIASGLSAAHEHGLIHRDIKPANIWMPENGGSAKILDFGLVRVNDEDPQLTCTGMIAGTPCYMSPEQSRGDQLDPRSDLFSLGCLMYQSLTGRLPFRSENALATLRSIQKDQPTAPSELDPSIPSDTSDLAMCLLEKSPNRRPPNAQAVIQALGSQQSGWGFEVTKPVAPAKPEPGRKTLSKFWKSIAAAILGIGVGVLAYSYGQQLIRIATNQGEIVIDTKVDDVEIEILENGKTVRVVDLATEAAIEIKAGNYQIRPVGEQNSIEIDKQQLVLKRGESEVVRITQAPDSNSTISPLLSQVTGSQDVLGGLLGGDLANTDSSQSLLALMGLDQAPYRLGKGDVLGIFIDGVLGTFDENPPIHYPDPETGLPPAIGFPIHVEHDGRIVIPLVDPINVAGKSIDEARNEIVKAFKEGDTPILNEQARIIVNLFRKKNPPVGSDKLAEPVLQEGLSKSELENRHRLQDEFMELLIKVTSEFEQAAKQGSNDDRQKSAERAAELLQKQIAALENMLVAAPAGQRGKEIRIQLNQTTERLAHTQQLVETLGKQVTAPNLKPTGEEYDQLNLLSRETEQLKLKAMRNSQDIKTLEALGASLELQLDFLDELTAKTTDLNHRASLKAQYQQLVNSATHNKNALVRLRSNPVANSNKELEKLRAEVLWQEKRFAANEIGKFELLQAKVKLLQHEFNGYGSGVDRLVIGKQLLELSNEQLDLIEKDENLESSEAAKHRDEVLAQKANASKMLTLWERDSGLPVSSPIYDGKTYQELLTIVRTERDLAKLNPAILGIANLADKYEQQEMLEAIFQVARRGVGVANSKHVQELNDTIEKIITRLDIETVKDLFITELKSGTNNSVFHFFRRVRQSRQTTAQYCPFASSIRDKVDVDPELAEPFVLQIIEALEEYSDSKQKLSQSFRFIIEAFENNWNHWGLPNKKSAKAICQRCFDEFSEMPDDLWWRNKLAVLMPSTKGFKEHLLTKLADVIKRTEKLFQQNGELKNGWSSRDKYFLNIFANLPMQDRPKEQIVALANIYLDAWHPDAVRELLLIIDENHVETMESLEKARKAKQSTVLRIVNDKVIVEGYFRD